MASDRLDEVLEKATRVARTTGRRVIVYRFRHARDAPFWYGFRHHARPVTHYPDGTLAEVVKIIVP